MRYILIWLGIVGLMIIVLMICFASTFKDLDFIYKFFNNQSIGVIIGSLGFLIGYFIWRKQKVEEDVSKYFEILLESSMAILTIDDSIIYEHSGQKNDESDKLFARRMGLKGKEDAYMMLLEKHNDKRPEKYRSIFSEYDDKLMTIMKNLRLPTFTFRESALKSYRSLRKEVRFKILDLVKGKSI